MCETLRPILWQSQGSRRGQLNEREALPTGHVDGRPGDIDDFADKVESRDAARLHGFRRELAGVDPADGDFRFRVTFGPGESQRPVMRKMGEGRQLALFGMANGPRGRSTIRDGLTGWRCRIVAWPAASAVAEQPRALRGVIAIDRAIGRARLPKPGSFTGWLEARICGQSWQPDAVVRSRAEQS